MTDVEKLTWNRTNMTEVTKLTTGNFYAWRS